MWRVTAADGSAKRPARPGMLAILLAKHRQVLTLLAVVVVLVMIVGSNSSSCGCLNKLKPKSLVKLQCLRVYCMLYVMQAPCLDA
jgi:hypothetical protein